MANKYSEIEVKFDADKVDVAEFCKYVQTLNPEKFLRVKGPDTYYSQNSNVVRHRFNNRTNVLTVKQRKSNNNIIDRHEIDLTFSKNTTSRDVKEFLQASGWKHELTLIKDAWIFWVEIDEIDLTFVIYNVQCDGFDNKRFIEIEVEKTNNISIEKAKTILLSYSKMIKDLFNLKRPLNKSLYEFYSNKKYIVRKKYEYD